MLRRTGALIGFGVLLVILAAVAAGGGYLVTHRSPVPDSAASTLSRPPLPSAYVGATSSPTPPPSPVGAAPVPAAVARKLAAAFADPNLGTRVLAEVIDADTGTVLLDHGAGTAAAPASTAKLATATALLTAYLPTARITTRVVAGSVPGTVVLVGAGDPTLSAAGAGQPTTYPDAARISALAAGLKGVRRVLVDTSLFDGPAISPAWAPGDAPSSFGAPITAAMIDGGRDAPGAALRTGDPAGAAGRALARALGLPASAVGLGVAPARAATLASVQSPPMSELVGQMLTDSDDVMADVLARLVAVARHQPASFTGAAAAVRAQIRTLGLDIGAGLVDGSGLAASDRLTPATLIGLLRLATGSAHPQLADIVAGLPIAGGTGTLADRFPGSAARGLVRAKTGTLTSVSTLAGVVHDQDGRLLLFALMADRVGPSSADTDAAEAALDRIAAGLAACGCT